MRLYIVRHGDPDYQNDTITPEGRKEAQALAERFARVGLDRIFSSPMGRAVATAQYTADRLGLPYKVEDWTHEIVGYEFPDSPWGDIVPWDVPGEILKAGGSGAKTREWDWRGRLEQMQFPAYLSQMRARSDAFLEKLGYAHRDGYYETLRPNEEKVAVFCHGGFGLTWISYLLDIPAETMWGSFWIPPTSVTTILFETRLEGRASPRCIGFGDVSHLYQAGLSVLPRGIQANFF